MSLVGMVIWHWYELKTALPEVNISKQSPSTFLKPTVSKSTVKRMLAKLRVYRFKAQPTHREAWFRRENFKQMFYLYFFGYSLQIWHGYTMESPLNSQMSLRVYDAM